MGSWNTKPKPEEPASENKRAEDGRTAEVHETQAAGETPSDVPQMTTQVHCVEDQTQQPPQVYCFEDSKQQPTQVYCVEENEGFTMVQSEGKKGQGPQDTSRQGSETASLGKTSGSSKVTCGTSEEGKIPPELMGVIEKIMESDASSTRTDIVCQSYQEGSGDSSGLKCDLYSTLMSDMKPPKVSKEHSEALPPPPPVEKLDSTADAKPQKEFKETRPDVPVPEVTGAQTTGSATQQETVQRKLR